VFVPVLFFGVPPLGVYFENMNDGVQRRAKAVEFLVLFFFLNLLFYYYYFIFKIISFEVVWGIIL
jgi:hypothetical protein